MSLKNTKESSSHGLFWKTIVVVALVVGGFFWFGQSSSPVVSQREPTALRPENVPDMPEEYMRLEEHTAVTETAKSASLMPTPSKDFYAEVKERLPSRGMLPLSERAKRRVKEMPASAAPVMNAGGSAEIVAFIDPQDPFSAQVFASLKKLVKERSDLKWRIHWNPEINNEMGSAKAQILTALSGHKDFWQAAELLMGSRLSTTNKTETLQVLASIGFEENAVMQSESSAGTQKRLSEDRELKAKLGVGRGAVVFINGVRMYDLELTSAESTLIDQVISLARK